MKAIKLIFIFLLILGGIVAAFYFATRTETVPKIDLSGASLEQYRQKFEDDWTAAGDWNEQTFKSHCDLIRQLGAQNYDVAALNDLNTSTAVEVVYEHIIKEWNSASCQKQTIDDYVKALATIEQAEAGASANPNVTLIRRVDAVYQKAYKFALKGIGLTPTFDGTNWNSYSNYADRINNEREDIENNADYKKYLSNISEISNGIQAIPAKLSNGRDRFYEGLANKIMDFYGYSRFPAEKRTEEDEKRVRNSINNYNEEYGSDSRLENFKRRFSEDVKANEERNENESY